MWQDSSALVAASRPALIGFVGTPEEVVVFSDFESRRKANPSATIFILYLCCSSHFS